MIPKMVPKKQQNQESPIALFEQILKRASKKNASDIHLKAGLPPIVRVHGSLYYLSNEAGEVIPRLNLSDLNQFSLFLMNERHRARYENGDEVDVAHEIPGVGRFRINICQQRSFPRFVCRLIPETIKNFEELGLPTALADLASAERGLVLITGATGSGKSSTVAAMVDYIARNSSSHIVTLEDPIEYSFKDRKSIITQREIGIDTKSFAQALKYALRQDPDVILVGEMRDEETILMALSAAETGHLVLSTLHTSDAMETVNRILGSVSAGYQEQVRHQLAAGLVGVVSQRLIPRVDGWGRVPAIEILMSNQRVKDMISDPKRTVDLYLAIQEGTHQGMQTFDQSIMKLLRQGLISKDEALKNATSPKDFQLRLGGVEAGIHQENTPSEAKKQVPDVQAVLESEPGSDASVELDIKEPNNKS
jgi:twitching motility protein PilT